jgi:hypothetical protein
VLLGPIEFTIWADIFADDSLLSTDALLQSIRTNYTYVLHFDQNYLIVIGVFFICTTLYITVLTLYHTCRCCCAWRQRVAARAKTAGNVTKQKKLRVDGKRDSCKRKAYTTILALFTMALV